MKIPFDNHDNLHLTKNISACLNTSIEVLYTVAAVKCNAI